jgi:hypothetical protein
LRADGAGALTLVWGQPGVPSGGVVVDVLGAGPGALVVLLAAIEPGTGFTSETCLGAARRILAITVADPAGRAQVPFSEAVLAGQGHPIGALRYFQAWQRLPGAPPAISTSPAFEWRHCR